MGKILFIKNLYLVIDDDLQKLVQNYCQIQLYFQYFLLVFFDIPIDFHESIRVVPPKHFNAIFIFYTK